MLSNKWTFSLTCLVLIMALALVVSPAMAAEFDVTLDTIHDRSTADGLQVSRPDTDLQITVEFALAVVLPAANVFVTTYDEDGDVTGFPAATVSPATASREKVLTIPVTRSDVKVNVRIAKGIASADPINDDTSKAFDQTIGLLDGDRFGGPTVYSIRRADNSLLPVKSSTVDVIITLSEEAKELKKDHIDVSNATHGDPVALTPQAQETLEDISRNVLATRLTLTPRRELYNDDFDDDGTSDDGIHAAIIADPPEALTNAIDDYNAAVTRHNADANVEVDVDPVAIEDLVTVEDVSYDIPLHRRLHTYSYSTIDSGAGGIEYPSVPNWTAGDDADTIQDTINDADILPLNRGVRPVRPVQGFLSGADYASALIYYQTELRVYELYQAEGRLRDAYLDAVLTEVQEDIRLNDQELLDAGLTLQRSTGRTDMLYPYVLTITPKYENKDDIVVRVKTYENTRYPTADEYMLPRDEDDQIEGRHKLTIKVGKEVLTPGTIGIEVVLAKEQFIPSDGYLVVADDEAGSAIVNPGAAKDAPPVTRTPAGLKYNLHANALPNLFAFLSSGGVIDVVSPMDLTITEIMWGTDASLVDDNTKSQWIELHNSGTGANTGENDAATKLIFYGYGQAPALNADGTLPTGVKDRVGTIDSTGIVWSLAGKGQNGRTGVGEEAGQLVAVAPKRALKSMYRLPSVAGEDGTASSSWMQYNGPPRNFDITKVGIRHGTPGADHIVTAADQAAIDAAAKSTSDAAAAATAAAAAKAQGTGTIPVNGNIYISEIMVDRGANLPQWIEIANGSRTEEVNLSGWTLTVDNATADTDVSVGASITFTIPAGTKIGMFGQQAEPSTLLVVTEAGRTSLAGTLAKGQVLNLWESNQDELILGGVTRRRYSLISEDAFLITLAPPAPVKTVVAPTATPTEKAAARAADARATVRHRAASDVIGNLGADGAAAWALPMNAEGGRSSIIRRHIPITRGPAAPQEGDDMEGWALASETSFAQPTHVRAASYYGAANDIGTPGFRAGGALPVELSHFRPARDKVTDAVVITWATQSELNNAGFFIKRSNQANGEFKVVNATIIPGAGTTSEKQFYTYTDTTASPNTVYYYQIEDVSLDGNRQTLTRGIRLKGHVGVAGKATVIWGELKDRD